MSILDNLYRMDDAAAELGVTTSRVRQLCINHNIGTKVGQYRFLTKSDINQLKKIRQNDGRRKQA